MIYTRIRRTDEAREPQIRTLCRELGISPLLAGILVRRDLTEPEKVKEFLEGKTQPYYDPFRLKDMDRAVDRILQALQQGEPMTIYGDYDVDGTSASSLLYLFLQARGAKVYVYVPRRDREGYGLNGPALEKIAARGTKLLITVDTGISGAQVVADAPKGLDIIITDHHLAPRQLPPALAVVNPNQPGDGYPFKGIAGVGVAFKLCQALEQRRTGQPDLYWDELIELVALGTKDLTLIANDMGRATGPMGEEFFGIAELIHNHQVKRVIATHVGMTPEVGQQHTEGTLEVNLLPQGTLAECIRAAGAGLGGVLTPVGIDTLVEESPFCMGRQTIDGKDYLLMKPIHADFALLGTYKCDEFGNCWYKGTMRNFNVVMATAADTVIAECEYIVPVGDFEPENIHTYGMCVDYIVEGDRK